MRRIAGKSAFQAFLGSPSYLPAIMFFRWGYARGTDSLDRGQLILRARIRTDGTSLFGFR
jgi:hypothetical protein